MKMKNDDLFTLKIDIQAVDDRKFLELATLFDKPKFLRYLPKIREKYGFDQLVSINKYHNTWDQLSDSDDKGKFDPSTYDQDNIQEIVDYAKRNDTWYFSWDDDEIPLLDRLSTDIAILCYIFKRPPYFNDCILQTILCGAVKDYFFDTTSVTIVENDALQTSFSSFQLPQVAILLSPTSTDLEIKSRVQEARRLFRTDKKLAYYKPRVDKVNRIRAYREWYWLRLAGKKYSEISDEWTDKYPDDSAMDESIVYKGVVHYKKLLSQ